MRPRPFPTHVVRPVHESLQEGHNKRTQGLCFSVAVKQSDRESKAYGDGEEGLEHQTVDELVYHLVDALVLQLLDRLASLEAMF